ncbi:hypothetical protein F5146DRAFT_1130818 [Armillaria mellea]|nr:hypothetical protein F5146DRAFT_1130818 [Armillaria mellea]
MFHPLNSEVPPWQLLRPPTYNMAELVQLQCVENAPMAEDAPTTGDWPANVPVGSWGTDEINPFENTLWKAPKSYTNPSAKERSIMANKLYKKKESAELHQKQLQREAHGAKFRIPSTNGAAVEDVWMRYVDTQQWYNLFHHKWDLNEEFDPKACLESEERDDEEFYFTPTYLLVAE